MKRCICARSHYGAGVGVKLSVNKVPILIPLHLHQLFVCHGLHPSSHQLTTVTTISAFLIFIFLMPGFTVSNFDTKGRECGCSRLFFGGRVNRREGPRAGSERGGETFSLFDHATINIFKMLFYSYKCFFTISSKTLTPGFQIPHSKLESKVPEYGLRSHMWLRVFLHLPLGGRHDSV